MKFTDGLICVFIGMVLAVLLLMVIPGNIAKVANDALEDCEATLPRDQNCKIIAVPEKQEKEAA